MASMRQLVKDRARVVEEGVHRVFFAFAVEVPYLGGRLVPAFCALRGTRRFRTTPCSRWR